MVWKILLGILLLLLLLLMCPVRLRIRLQNEGNISIRAHAFCVPPCAAEVVASRLATGLAFFLACFFCSRSRAFCP